MDRLGEGLLIQRSNNDRKGANPESESDRRTRAVVVAIVRHQDSITLPALPAWTEMLGASEVQV